jgi:hypothetical protein
MQSIPAHPIPLRSILVLSTYPCLALLSGLFPYGFTINIWIYGNKDDDDILYAFLFLCMLLGLPFSLYLVKGASFEVPHCAVFSNLLLHHSSSVHIYC